MADKKYQITPDSQLWIAFLKGDENAFNLIYKINIQSLYKYGLNFSQDENLVKDCIHDVFVDLYKYRQKLNETNNIRLYLFKALKNSILKAILKNRKFYLLENVDVKFFYESPHEDTLIEKDTELYQLNLINDALASLSTRQKEALYLKFNTDLEYEEISKVLDINYQSARNLVYRGIEKIREYCRKKGVLVLFSFIELNRK